jgi:glycosyltransferase involved in cell wall biosynthesis
MTTSDYRLAKSLRGRGHTVTVFTSDFGREKSKSKDDGNLTIVESRCVANLSGFLFTPGMRKQLKEHARDIDIFDLSGFRTYQNVVATKLAREQKMPYVLRAHGSVPRLGKSIPKWIFDKVYGYEILDLASNLVALTHVEASQYKEFGVDSNRISLIPNGVELSSFSNLPMKGDFVSKFDVNHSKMIILFLGRIHWIKGIDTLLKSYSRLTKNRTSSDTLLVIAGPDDGYLKTAQQMALSLDIGANVLFCGLLNSRDKLAAIVDSSVVVLPSYYEAFPNVVLEAYACSRPVIASRVQAMEDLVLDGQTGLLFSAGNVEQLTECISSVLRNVEWSNVMGKRARELVEREYDQSKLILLTEALYEEIAGAPRVTPPDAH